MMLKSLGCGRCKDSEDHIIRTNHIPFQSTLRTVVNTLSIDRRMDTKIVAVPFDNNETGSYLRRFTVPSFMLGQQIRLRFEGADSAFHLWINGHLVGYSQGSRNPSEFDITDHVLAEEENVLAVRVYQFCDGSYIEDQGALFSSESSIGSCSKWPPCYQMTEVIGLEAQLGGCAGLMQCTS